MKKLLKIGLIAAGAVVVLVVVVVLLVAANLGSIVRVGVEKGGSHVLKVEVKLDSASISILRGRAHLSGFTVANPPGYSSNPALGFGGVTAEVKPFSLTEDLVDIPEIIISRPEVSFEGDVAGGTTNIAQLKKNLAETLASSGKAAPPSEEPAEAPSGEPKEAGAQKRLKLDHILLENPKVTLAAKLLGRSEQKTSELGTLELKDLAEKHPQGLTPAEAAQLVLDELLRAALKDQGEIGQALQKLADKGVLGTMKSVTDDATKLGTEIIKDPGKATDVIKDPDKAIDSIQDVKDIKDVFKKKRK